MAVARGGCRSRAAQGGVGPPANPRGGGRPSACHAFAREAQHMTMMVYAQPPPRRARIRDSQAEVETRIFVRAPWRNVFLQPPKPSDPPPPWSVAPRVAPSDRHEETLARPRQRARR